MTEDEQFLEDCSALELKLIKLIEDIDNMKKEIWFTKGVLSTIDLDSLEKGAAENKQQSTVL